MLVNISFEDEEHLEYVDIINMPDEIAGNLDEMVNEFITKEEKTTIVAVSSREIDDTLPMIYF